jgi:chromosome partitioning protein
MRNDHQDALGKGLGVTEFSATGRSAEEMRALWQWVARRLGAVATSGRPDRTSDLKLPSAA